MSKALLYELGKSISFGRLSLKAKVLWPMLLASSDDQGRGIAESDAVKWHVCPNVNEIEIPEIPALLAEMDKQGMIHLYHDERDRQLYQVIRWWEFQQHTWAHPSRYAAPEGWLDRERYQAKGGGHVTHNWDHPGGFVDTDKEPVTDLPSSLPSHPGRPTTKLNLTKPNLTKGEDLAANAAPETPAVNSDYQEIRQTWIALFPEKPKPRANNQTLQQKVTTRMKSAHFRENWGAALERASTSKFLAAAGWFDLGWFLRNDDHYERCLNGNYDDKKPSARASPSPKPAAARKAEIAENLRRRSNGNP